MDLSAALPVLGAITSASGARKQNSANKKMAREQMRFQERMSNSAYQRSMADMKKAGLNPMLAYSKGGASTPGGATAQMVNTLEPAVNSAQTITRLRQDLKNQKQVEKKLFAETQVANGQKLAIDYQNIKAAKMAEFYETEPGRLALIRQQTGNPGLALESGNLVTNAFDKWKANRKSSTGGRSRAAQRKRTKGKGLDFSFDDHLKAQFRKRKSTGGRSYKANNR